MALARIQTLAIQAQGVVPGHISAQLQGGLPETRVLGHPSQASFRDRLRAAIKGAGYRYPSVRVTLDLESTGQWDDAHLLPCALAILQASDQVRMDDTAGHLWLGRLRLDGSLDHGQEPWLSAQASYETLVCGSSGRSCIRHLSNIKPTAGQLKPHTPECLMMPPGQPTQLAQWLLAGGLSAFVYGEPGVGKSKATQAIHAHWPDSPTQRMHRMARWYRRRRALPAMRASLPARATPAQMKHWFEVYQGQAVVIDDLPLHSQALRDGLNQMLDEHRQTAVLASGNPCACGWLGSLRKACRCNASQQAKWARALSAPLMDRFDVLWRFDYTDCAPQPIDLSDTRQAQTRQYQRQGCLNGQRTLSSLDQIPGLGSSLTRQLRIQAQGLGLSGRAQLSVASLAQTLADLAGRDSIRQDDLTLALGLRASPTDS